MGNGTQLKILTLAFREASAPRVVMNVELGTGVTDSVASVGIFSFLVSICRTACWRDGIAGASSHVRPNLVTCACPPAQRQR